MTIDNAGVVYKFSGGSDVVLHNFLRSGTDGINPYASLILFKKNLYGTTTGGNSNGGTVFKITPSGTETVLHNFTNADGTDAAPAAREAASSPRGYMSRQLPTGARISGMGNEVPSTVVRRSHTGVATAQRGRNVTASNARQFARNVHSSSAPPSM